MKQAATIIFALITLATITTSIFYGSKVQRHYPKLMIIGGVPFGPRDQRRKALKEMLPSIVLSLVWLVCLIAWLILYSF